MHGETTISGDFSGCSYPEAVVLGENCLMVFSGVCSFSRWELLIGNCPRLELSRGLLSGGQFSTGELTHNLQRKCFRFCNINSIF